MRRHPQGRGGTSVWVPENSPWGSSVLPKLAAGAALLLWEGLPGREQQGGGHGAHLGHGPQVPTM